MTGGGDGLDGSAVVGGGDGSAIVGGGDGLVDTVGGGDGLDDSATVGGEEGFNGSAVVGGGIGAPRTATMPNTSCRSIPVSGLPVPLVSRRTVPSGPVTVSAIVPGGAARRRHEDFTQARTSRGMANLQGSADWLRVLRGFECFASIYPAVRPSNVSNAHCMETCLADQLQSMLKPSWCVRDAGDTETVA